VASDQVYDILIKEAEQLRRKLEKVSDQLVKLLQESSGNAYWRAMVDQELLEFKKTCEQARTNQQHIEELRLLEERRQKRVILFWSATVPLVVASCGKLLWDLITWYTKQ
jgi:hypothetical protein